MDSNDSKGNSQSEQDYSKDSQTTRIRIENPFIAFRRFADETIGSALQSLIGLPSAVSKQLEGSLPGLDKIREEDAGHHEEPESFRERFRRSHRNSNSEDQAPQNLLEELKRHRAEHRKRWEYIREAIHQGPDAELEVTQTCEMDNNNSDRFNGRDLTPQNRDFDRQTPAQYPRDSAGSFIESFLRDTTGMFDSHTFGPLESFLHSRLNTTMPDSIVPYLLFSPYSPLFLSNRMYDTSDKNVRLDPFPYCDAFEDLMLASRGREMVPLGERQRRNRETPLPIFAGHIGHHGLALSWLQRLQQQGLLDNLSRADEHLEEDDGTELGMYQRFLSGAFPRSSSQPHEERSQTSSETAVNKEVKFGSEATSSKDGVLSTLTRTESKKYPDGRVETKVVLIKRFADGGETRTETVNTDYEGASSSQGGSEDNTQIKPKKGWFWN